MCIMYSEEKHTVSDLRVLVCRFELVSALVSVFASVCLHMPLFVKKKMQLWHNLVG